MNILITGGAGFIGSNFVIDWLNQSDEALDKLTYAGNIATHQPSAVINFAAESQVDHSIHGPAEFIQNHIVSTFNFLEAVRGYWPALGATEKAAFRFPHVPTDEVDSSLAKDDAAFTEFRHIEPNSRDSVIRSVLEAGRLGEIYNVGDSNEKANLEHGT